MIIECILHVRSSKMDFYSSDYFGKDDTTEKIDPFTLSDDGQLYGYGLRWDEAAKDFTIPVVIDLRKAKEYLKDEPIFNLNSFWTTNSPCYFIASTLSEIWGERVAEAVEVTAPLVPPPLVHTSRTTLINDSKYMDIWLSHYDESHVPTIIHPAAHKDCTGPIVSGKDVVFTFRQAVIRPQYTMPIVNGFACFPQVSGSNVIATNAAQYLGTPSDRNRQYILVDFKRVGGCQFHRIRDLVGDLSEFQLPEFYDEKDTSVMVVVDGRILTQKDYDIFANRVHINPMRLTAMPELDRQICLGNTITANTRIVTTDGSRDLYQSDNSFIVLINKYGLQMVEHDEWFMRPEETQTTDTSSYFCCDKHVFSQMARGLLYDRATRSVHDYVQTPETSTFYAEENEGVSEHEIVWKSSVVTINPERPMVILAGTRDNLMSAKAMLFDRARSVASDDVVVWPKFALLDLVFRG